MSIIGNGAPVMTFDFWRAGFSLSALTGPFPSAIVVMRPPSMELCYPRHGRGWSKGMRGGWYQRKNDWVAIVRVSGTGYEPVLRRNASAFETALAVGNQVIEIEK